MSLNMAGQGEAANWFFGENAGINFDLDSNAVTSLNGGQLNTREGCASISDQDGNLLFYTDGSNVYNRFHAIMDNGTDLFGDDSSTQSAIVVPKPNSSRFYYIFTVGSNLNPTGLNYSEVDITQNNGLGRVTNKNINLVSASAEKVSAVVKDCVTGSIWVITLANSDGVTRGLYDTFYAFEVTNSGVNNTPVKSVLGLNITDARGYLKLSPDGTKLACANVQSGLYLLDFDSQTGLVSNPINLQIANANNKPYGVEFSPSNQFLYVTSSNDFFVSADENNDPSNHFSVLLQFDLDALNISNSQVVIDSRQLFRGGLQLGPDGKIYRALSATYLEGLPYLGVIKNPNSQGLAANYFHNAVNLGSNNCTQGLPPFIQSFFNEKIDIIRNGFDPTYLTLCEGDTYTLMADDIPGATYSWTLDRNPLPNNNFYLEVNQGGNYELTIKLNDDECQTLEGQAIVRYVTYPEAFDSALIQCDDDIKDGLTIFNLNEAFDDITGRNPNVFLKFHFTLDDAINNENAIIGNAFNNTSNPQTLYVQVINDGLGVILVGGDPQNSSSATCSSIAELTLSVSNNKANDAFLTSCDNDGTEDGFYNFNLSDADADVLNGLPPNVTLNYYITYNNALLEQNPLPNSYINTTPYSQTIYVRVENDNDCFGINQVQLNVFELPDIVIEEELFYCLNSFPQTITLTSGVINDLPSNYTYSWSTGETTSEIEINQSGTFNVTVTNANGCSKDRTITVLPSNIATINSIDVVDATQNNTITVSVSGEGTYEFALDDSSGPYQVSNLFENVAPGLHTVYVMDTKNSCGIVEKIVSVIGFPKFFTPNNDSFNDTWQVYGLSKQFQPNSTIFIYDRYGKLLKQLDPTGIGWDGTFNGYRLPSSDYWFYVTLQDGRIFANHFTLKR